jgi:hypothetical protein
LRTFLTLHYQPCPCWRVQGCPCRLWFWNSRPDDGVAL